MTSYLFSCINKQNEFAFYCSQLPNKVLLCRMPLQYSCYNLGFTVTETLIETSVPSLIMITD